MKQFIILTIGRCIYFAERRSNAVIISDLLYMVNNNVDLDQPHDDAEPKIGTISVSATVQASLQTTHPALRNN